MSVDRISLGAEVLLALDQMLAAAGYADAFVDRSPAEPYRLRLGRDSSTPRVSCPA